MPNSIDDYSPMVWKVLSYIVFLAIYAIVWRNVYKESQRNVDEAFAGVRKKQGGTKARPASPIQRLLNAFLLKNNYEEQAPYSLFSLLVYIFMILMWLLLYVAILYFLSWFCDKFIIRNSLEDPKGANTNYVHIVLTAFMGNEVAFITEACMTCMSLVVIMAILIYIGFFDLLLHKATAKVFVKAVLIVILVAVPLVSLIQLVKEPLLKALNIEG